MLSLPFMSFSGGAQPLLITVSDLISEHTLISGHPHFVLVEIIARACRDLCVLAMLLRCIMQSIFDAN